MRKLVAGLAITLDGVVESPDAWMLADDEMTAMIDEGTRRADTVLLGRRTYLDFAELWPAMGDDVPMAAFMNGADKYVASRTLRSVEWANSTLLSGDLVDEVVALKDRPGKDILIPGSPRLVRALLAAGQLDELSLMVHPTVVGSGTRLFDDVVTPVDVELTESATLRSGVLSVTYRPSEQRRTPA
jgi:dihydrofolate reductase